MNYFTAENILQFCLKKKIRLLPSLAQKNSLKSQQFAETLTLTTRATIGVRGKFMTLETIVKSELGKEFESAARSLKKRPADWLAELMTEAIEIATDIQLDDEIELEGRKSGYAEDDAVELVRRARRERDQN